MTWDATTSNGFESAKIAAVALPYLRGKGLDIGCGMQKIWPSAIGMDSQKAFGPHTAASIMGEGDDLSLFQDEALDYVFSSHLLEHFERDKVRGVLTEWTRVIKPGGYLVLYLPSANLYPRMGEFGANPDHKWDIFPGDIEDIINTGVSDRMWRQVEREERSGTNEYSLFLVFQKTVQFARGAGLYISSHPWQRNPGGKKRALVIRYGAIGDQIVAASILPGLKAKGYHVTYNTTPDAQQIVLHDPHIDEFLIQDRDFVPNPQLGAYWESLAERYDLIVNLCESIEGALLKLAGRLEHGYSDATRRKLYGHVNYLERTHDIAGVSYDFAPKFYPTTEEEREASAWGSGKNKAPIIAWAIAGSAFHKIYPYTNIVIRWLLDRTDAHIVLLGDAKEGRLLQAGILEAVGPRDGRVHPMAGEWNIRRALTFAHYADIVIGPETGVLNAVCMEPNRKIVYLSHSSRDNLTKHWVNTTALTPSAEAFCYPCHRLHNDGTYCHKVERTAAALCATEIAPEAVYEAIATSLDALQPQLEVA